jgi:transcriptional regulator with XRE-family HTH domain
VPRTLYTTDHERLVELLRHYRQRAGLRQAEVAERLGRPQSFVSKVEAGQRRLDLIELNAICVALDVSVVTVVKRWTNGASQP